MDKQVMAFKPEEYDEKILMTLPYYNDMLQQTIDVIKFGINRKDLSWLDIGCGTGKLAENALEQLSISKFVLSDISDEMLKLAKVRLESKKNHIEYIRKASQDICFREEFDVVTSIQVHHYLLEDDRYKAIQNCYNALKTNGLYITFENYIPFSKEGTENALERWKNYQLSKGRTLSKVESHLSRFGKEFYPINLEKHLNLLKQVGFHSMEIFWVTYMQAGLWARK